MYSHRGGVPRRARALIETGLDRDSRYLWTLPMFHCNGWTYPWAVTAAGATHVCLPAGRPGAASGSDLRHGITHLCGAPTVLVSLYSHPDAAPLERPLSVTTAARRPRRRVIARMEALGSADRPPVRADRDLRPVQRLRVAGRVGRAARRGARTG